MNEEIEQIKKILYRIREEKYPNIPQEVLDKIIDIQINNPDSPVNSQKDVSTYLLEYFKTHTDVKAE